MATARVSALVPRPRRKSRASHRGRRGAGKTRDRV